MAEAIAKKYGLKLKSKFNERMPNVMATKTAWETENWDEFLKLNQHLVDVYGEKVRTGDPSQKWAAKWIFDEVAPRHAMATTAKAYAPALALLAEGFNGKNKGKIEEALQVMHKAAETAEKLEHGKDIAGDIKKKIAQVQKEMGKL